MNHLRLVRILRLLAWTAALLLANPAALAGDPAPTRWQWCGWGGGGFFWATAYHPSRPGVIYMGGDCAGCYKSDDDGKNWRMINRGLIDYGVYGLAVDQQSPDTVYAVTEAGGCKSTDAGENWVFLPDTAKGKLGIVADRHISVRPLAVDPSNSNVVYAATPRGKIYKSQDGAKTWQEVFQLAASETVPADALYAAFPDGPPYYGGFFIPVTPTGAAGAVSGIAISLKSNGASPRTAHLTLGGPDSAVYRSKNLASLLSNTDWQDIVLAAEDFVIDPAQAQQKKDKSANWPRQVDFKTVNRVDFACSGMPKPLTVFIRSIYFALAGGNKSIVKDFSVDKNCNKYGGIDTAGPKPGAFASICVSSKAPQLILAASPQAGAFLSKDAGQTWQSLNTPKTAHNVIADPRDASILYGAFGIAGVYKSTDGGSSWTQISKGIQKNVKVKEIAVSPANSTELVCIGEINWNGFIYWSDDGGQTWKEVKSLKPDPAANPTWGMGQVSRPTNITYSPTDPKKLYVSANWRSIFSDDGGRTWVERDRGADISCVYDVRFSGKRVYASCMDEGVLFSDDNGNQWQQAWPRIAGVDSKTAATVSSGKISGHYWRLAISNHGGLDRIVSTCSPWNANQPNLIVVSEDNAKTFKIVTGSGLLDYKPNGNTMWGQSYPRALTPDPKDPKTIYLGMDGDPAPGKPGGGIFKTTDGGYNWTQLSSQPGSRRMFFGLAVDPTDSKRIYWGACGNNGGLWRSQDGGESWKLVFKNETWIFNVLVTADGTVYAPGKDLWRSNDHGQTWKKLTNWSEGQIIGLEIHPHDPKTLWYSVVKHGGTAWGHIMKTTDGGVTWQEITGDIGFRKPVILRFNSATSELWAGGVGLFKTPQ